MTQNSNESYKNNQDEIARTQKKIYEAVKILQPCTYHQVQQFTGLQQNTTTSALHRLESEGWVYIDGTKHNDKTKRGNSLYYAYDEQHKPKETIKHKPHRIHREDLIAIKNYQDVVRKDYTIIFHNRNPNTLNASLKFSDLELHNIVYVTVKESEVMFIGRDFNYSVKVV